MCTRLFWKPCDPPPRNLQSKKEPIHLENIRAYILDANFSRALALGSIPPLSSYHLPNLASYPYGAGLENQQTFRLVYNTARKRESHS